MPEDKLIIESKKSKECDGHKVFSIRIKEEIVKKSATFPHRPEEVEMNLLECFRVCYKEL